MTGGALDARVVVDRSAFRLDARLAVAAGETLAVMGPSGAGKSTLLAALAGVIPLDDGHVRVAGVEVSGAHTVPPQRRGVVLMGQDARLFPHLNAHDNIAFGLRAHGASRHEAHASATRWLDRVGLGGYDGRRPDALSGGQQQRVALARALATSPRVLLLDEPLTGLDAETAGDIRALLAEQLAETRMTSIVVTHDALDAASLADRLLLLEEGAVSQEGEVRAVLASPATRFGAAAAGINRLLGTARGGAWELTGPDGTVRLRADDPESQAAAAHDGVALVAFVRPSAVSVTPVAGPAGGHPVELAGTDAGSWTARIVRLEQTPTGALVHLDTPSLRAEVAADAVAAWGLAPGVTVRIAIAAADVRFARAG